MHMKSRNFLIGHLENWWSFYWHWWVEISQILQVDWIQRLIQFMVVHWPQIAPGILVNIGSCNCLLFCRCQAFGWTKATLFSIGPFRTKFNEIVTKIQHFSVQKMQLNRSSAKCQPFCFGLKVFQRSYNWGWVTIYVSINYIIIGSDNGL